jgi:hypothetical protein
MIESEPQFQNLNGIAKKTKESKNCQAQAPQAHESAPA